MIPLPRVVLYTMDDRLASFSKLRTVHKDCRLAGDIKDTIVVLVN